MTEHVGPSQPQPDTAALAATYERLLEEYGPQHWWPGDGPWDVMVGAVLTQHTAWTNVEHALASLRVDGPLSPQPLRRLTLDDLTERLRPAGTFRVKAERVRALLAWSASWDDDLDRMGSADLLDLRGELLAVRGIGPETADAILLYALGMPTFVVDAYCRRIFGRMGIGPDGASYAEYQRWLHEGLEPEAYMYGEYHALLVRHGKVRCGLTPRCSGCCLQPLCHTGNAGQL